MNKFEHYDLDDLYNSRRNLNDRIDNFFGGGQVYHGDRGYQDLLEDLEDVENEIEKYENFSYNENDEEEETNKD